MTTSTSSTSSVAAGFGFGTQSNPPGSSNSSTNCELCFSPGGDLLWHDAHCRVVRVTGSEATAFPGYCRVIWTAHLAEMTDLSATRAKHMMDIVLGVERALRGLLKPDKINLASLGNVVPHVHWHVIPRWKDDSHFPAPIWATPQRPGVMRPVPSTAELIQRLQVELPNALPTLAPKP